MERTTHCDVIVIGGGIIGAAIAYYSAKAGLDITVLEKDELASGTSSRCDAAPTDITPGNVHPGRGTGDSAAPVASNNCLLV